MAMVQPPMAAQQQHMGVIKSYGLRKGFGFITCDDFPSEVFFANRALPSEIVESFEQRSGVQLAGKPVTFSLLSTESGKLQAAQVAIVAGDGDDIVGRVKSYNGIKGYGFMASASVQGDIFFSRRDLPTSAQDMQLTGATAKFKLAFAPDGKPQAKQVMPQGVASAMPALPWGGGGKGFEKGWGMGYKGGGYDDGWGKGFGKAGGGPAMWALGDGGAGRGRDYGMQGVIKSYDTTKGYGFILSPEVPKDIYFQGQGGVFNAGDSVSFYLQWTQDGRAQARGVTPGFTDGEVCQGSVKTYNPQKGFGFLQVPDKPGDVYFKKEMVPDFLQEEDLAGRMAQFTVHMASHGKPQVSQMEIVETRPGVQAATAGVKRARPPSTPPGAAMTGMGAAMTGMGAVAKRPKVELAGEGEMMEGQVKSYKFQNGWGFLRNNDFPQDIYFKGHFAEAVPGATARFSLHWTPDGKPQAGNVSF